MVPPTAGGEAERVDELGDGQPGMVGAARLCRVRVDGRGSGKSPGQCEPWSLAEAIDFYDAIEWAAAQPWCNGKVGLSGISYYAINQWFVANQQPPSLKAMIPWEGFADIYRDALYHGGILSVFMTNWFTAHLMHHKLGRASQQLAGRLEGQHAGLLAVQQSRQRRACRRAGAMGQDHRADALGRQLDRLRPASARQHRSVHARRLEAQEAAHPHRQPRASVLHRGGPAGSGPLLRLLAQGHRQRRHGRAAGQARHPPGRRQDRMARRARMAARAHAMDQILFRPVEGRADGKEPRAGTLVREQSGQGELVHLSAHLGTMGSTSAASSQVMGGGIKPGMGVALETPPLAADIEVTGPLAASFWVSSESEDMDLFLTLRNFDADGNEIMETGQQGTPVPVAKGWLRVSHRELDPELSLPYRPVSRAQAPAVPQARRDREGRRRDLADLDGVQKRPPHPARRAAARRRRQPGLHALSRRLQHRHQHHPCRRRVRVVSAAAGHSGEDVTMLGRRSRCHHPRRRMIQYISNWKNGHSCAPSLPTSSSWMPAFAGMTMSRRLQMTDHSVRQLRTVHFSPARTCSPG